ncbi:MAG: hypothetical protein M0027_06600 [Candidatus Dormibacteraeota bacterium]|nr:hypothetical protein [Candidatus Dormibacteraeota bacterium]
MSFDDQRLTEIAEAAIAEATEVMFASEGGDLIALNALNAQPAQWPEPLDAAAFHGLAGEFVGAAQPHSEADPAALLVSFLVGFGSAVVAGPHAAVGATRHPARLFAVLVGQTAKARKGESWSPVYGVLAEADPSWPARVQQGLSTGEGVIAAVRDAVHKTDPKTAEPRVPQKRGSDTSGSSHLCWGFVPEGPKLSVTTVPGLSPETLRRLSA